MPYCKYCLKEHAPEDMLSPKTCKFCRQLQFKRGALKAKSKRQARNSRIKRAVIYYFQKSRIKHKPFPGDEAKIQELLAQMLKVNRYKRRLVSVDHIIPVSHPRVSGLTVSWNLQLLLHEENMSKGNFCNLEAEAQYLLQWCKDKGL